jgi:hypothetical protein
MAGLSPQYWVNKQMPNRSFFEYGGGETTIAQWKEIIDEDADWVELFTWNDWDEATYLSPIDDPAKYGSYNAHTQLGFYHSHAGSLALTSYFIEWYKCGKQPPIKNDRIYYFYRTQPKDLVAPNDPLGPVTDRWGDVLDDTFVTTILTAPARLVVIGGGQRHVAHVPTGLSSTRLPFTPGDQTIELWRNGRCLIRRKGAPINIDDDVYNFIYETGFGQD